MPNDPMSGLTHLLTRLMLALLAASLAACSSSEPLVVVTQDPQPWPTAAPADVGIDGARLEQAVASLPAPAEHGMHSMLVLRRGKLVREVYWNGYGRDIQQDLRSATKSITALLTGIAIDRGAIAGVGQPLRTYLKAAYPAAPALAHDITLEHLMTMRSGLACDDRDAASPGQEDRMYRQRDWVGYFLNLPVAHAPGADTHYCTGGVVTLGRIIAEATRQPIPAFAGEALFAPLGIVGTRWAQFDGGGQTDTGGHLKLRPRDLAKIGQLVLQQGRWNGRQLVSAEWIAQATREHTRIEDRRMPYGYLWWLSPTVHHGKQVQVAYASGNGGQYLFVVPELELVVVFTGGNYNSSKAGLPFKVMSGFILPAVQ